MKITKIMATAVSGIVLLAGCTQDYTLSSLDEIQLSETFISIPAEGGTVKVELNAEVDWAFEKIFETKNEVKDEDGNTVYEDHEAVMVYSETPAWLTVNHLSGTAGNTVLEFTAENNNSVGREDKLIIKAGDKYQNLTVRQGEIEAAVATVKDVFDGVNGQTFVVTGTCTRITSTTYGNWYMKDDSTDEELYIYGTVDNTGNYSWDSFDIEVGDKVTVRGTKTVYNGVVEFEDARFVSVEKSLIQGFDNKLFIPAGGGEVTARFLVKGGSMEYEFPEDLGWAKIKEITTIAPDTTAVVFSVEAMPDKFATRRATVTFGSANSDGSSEFGVELVQYPDATETMQGVFDRIDAASSAVTVEGVIAATCTEGFLLSKDNDLIFVNASEFYDTVYGKVGATVRVSGVAEEDYDGPRIGSIEFVEIVNAEGTYEPGTPVDITGNIDDITVGDDGLYDITYFTATGYLSDPHHNLNIAEASTQLAFYGNESDDFDLDAYCDYCNKDADGNKLSTPNTIKVTGYYINRRSFGFNFIVTGIDPALDEE